MDNRAPEPRVATAKIIPPAGGAPVLDRPRLESLLDEVTSRRLTTVIADAGFGKSTLLGEWLRSITPAWYTVTLEDRSLPSFALGLLAALRLRIPDLPGEIAAGMIGSSGPDSASDEAGRARAFAAALSESLYHQLKRDLVLILDDFHELGSGTASGRVIDELCRQAPSTLHLVLAGRSELPFQIERLRGQGQVLEITGAELTFTLDELKSMLRTSLGSPAENLASDLQRVTGGWPAAVRLTLESLKTSPVEERPGRLARVTGKGGPLYAYLAREVFESESPEVRKLVREMAVLDRFTAGVCEDLGIPNASELLTALARRGLFVEPSGHEEWFSLNAPLGQFAREQLPLGEDERRWVHRTAARWFERHGYIEEAVKSLEAMDDHKGLAHLLEQHGSTLLAHGAVDTLIRAIERVPSALRGLRTHQLEGEALQVRGDWVGALACYEHVARGSEHLEPDIAWRMVLIHYLSSEPDLAMETFDRALLDGSDPRNEALLLAWTATVHWMRGEAKLCREKAEQAMTRARGVSDSEALAVTHTILALLAALEGDRRANDAHYIQALEHAERTRDVLLIARVRTNRASHHMEESSYPEALDELDIAIRLADLAGFVIIQALALANRGEVKFYIGKLDEAIADNEAAKALYQRANSRRVSYPLCTLADIHRERGENALARAAYEEAIVQSEQPKDLQALVPALSGLARLLATEDPVRATELAGQALELAVGLERVPAMLAAGWVTAAQGNRDAALAQAVEVAQEARTRRDRAGLAEALELRAMTCGSDAEGARLLEQAGTVWREIGNPLGEARIELAIANIRGEPLTSPRAERSKRFLRDCGVRLGTVNSAGLLHSLHSQTVGTVEIQTLGGFRVVRDGTPIPRTAWQSKKARDLLKILVGRRGRSVSREYLMETLWPDEEPRKVANRFSVALATLRAVLDPDKRFDPGHFVAADQNDARIDLDHLSVDVEAFFAQVAAGLQAQRAGDEEEAIDHLTRAESLYSGDFLEEDPYEDWSVAVREEARDSYTKVARELAERAVGRGDDEAAVRYLLRILERDAFDEQAYLELIGTLSTAGRHGEARRWYGVYSRQMEEIGIESAPFPVLLQKVS
jgi:ATP/maltotriose-dependent transcriptional regulator MalT/DNA-binding SARP family transcriptional activator